MEKENEHSYFTHLFMTLVGIGFILIMILPICVILRGMLSDSYKNKNEKIINASVMKREVNKTSFLDNYKVIYQVEYEIKDKKYNKTISDSLISNYNEGEIVELAYYNNPENIEFPTRHNFNIGDLLLVVYTLPFAIIGVLCLKKYGVWMYRNEILVK